MMRTVWSTIFAISAVGLPHCASAQTSDYTPPKIDTRSPGGVNLADGSFIYTSVDLSIGTLSLERFHLGGLKDPANPFFGPRMSHNFDIFVAKNKVGAVRPFLSDRYKPIVHIGSGASGVYVQSVSSTYVDPSSDDSNSGKLAFVSSAYVYTTQDGTIYTFNPSIAAAGALGGPGSQRVATVAYPNGRLETFAYNSSGLLKEVSDNAGYAIIFDYSGSVVSAACGFDLAATFVTSSSTCTSATLKASYSYTSSLLTGVTDVLLQTTNYTYSGNEIACIKPPGYSSCKTSNSYVGFANFQVSQQTLADGQVWNFGYSGNYVGNRDPNIYAVDDPTNNTSITDPNSKISYFAVSKTSPYTVTDAIGRVTNYRYTGGNDYEGALYPDPKPILAEGTMLIEADFPEGNKFLAEYAGPNNAVSKQTWVSKTPGTPADVVIQYGYSCPSGISPTCAKPITKTDPKGNVTNFDYYSWGAIKSEMQPAPSTGAARPLKLYDYVQKYAYIKNSGGTLVAASYPIWLPNSETECQTVAGSSTATCDTGAPMTVTTYEYGANGTADNLLLRGKVVTSGGVSLRTCYGYDALSNKIWETSPRAGLASCS